jgi:hypothetical protein
MPTLTAGPVPSNVVDLNRKTVACNISVVVTFRKAVEAISSDVSKAL